MSVNCLDFQFATHFSKTASRKQRISRSFIIIKGVAQRQTFAEGRDVFSQGRPVFSRARSLSCVKSFQYDVISTLPGSSCSKMIIVTESRHFGFFKLKMIHLISEDSQGTPYAKQSFPSVGESFQSAANLGILTKHLRNSKFANPFSRFVVGVGQYAH